MALNYSHRPTFPAHRSEDNMWSPMGMVNGGVSEKNGEDCHARPWHVNHHEESGDWPFNFRGDTVDFCCSPEPNSRDVVDLLPSDPFGMDIETTFFTAITGWLEDLEVDYGRTTGHGNYNLFSDWNKLVWSNAFNFQPFIGSILRVEEKPCVANHSFSGSVMTMSDEKLNLPMNESTSCGSELQFGEKVLEDAAECEGIPYEASLSILSCLGVKDLLSVERVCKSLYSTVRSEPWLWKSIRIDQPLNERITDGSLSQLASRAGGRLQCLSLVECPKVTDDGIKKILETNPQLTKLFVPGCTRLTIEGILNNIKIHNSNKGVPGIKHLRIGQLFGVTHEHFEELKSLLGLDGLKPQNHHKPHFYHWGNIYLPFEDDRPIDIEMCPRCEKFRLVYDCPAEGCQVKEPSGSKVCRACPICIARCAQCGRCISDNEYEETFCLDLLCSDCFKQMLKCEDRVDKKAVDTSGALHEPSLHQ